VRSLTVVPVPRPAGQAERIRAPFYENTKNTFHVRSRRLTKGAVQ
jgi:hypothetical protein